MDDRVFTTTVDFHENFTKGFLYIGNKWFPNRIYGVHSSIIEIKKLFLHSIMSKDSGYHWISKKKVRLSSAGKPFSNVKSIWYCTFFPLCGALCLIPPVIKWDFLTKDKDFANWIRSHSIWWMCIVVEIHWEPLPLCSFPKNSMKTENF